MSRRAFFLLLAVLASALYLVNVQYESRQLYSELDRARSQARNIETDYERLQVEKRAQAAPLRVEKLAKEQLQMRTVTPAITHYASYADAASAPQRAGASASAQGAAAVLGRTQ
ncbi:MAG: cell division protein FtsL [Comamonadaceae bacterium]